MGFLKAATMRIRQVADMKKMRWVTLDSRSVFRCHPRGSGGPVGVGVDSRVRGNDGEKARGND